MKISTLNKQILTIVALVAIVFAIVYLESRKVETGDTGENADIASNPTTEDARARALRKGALYERAKEITTPDDFINTDEFTLANLIGKKVVLVDFWTYSCINCQRTLPYLNNWFTEYEDDGLVIIGVHTPEFEFEKEYSNVLQAAKKFDIKYPVVLDNDYSTWHAYKNQYWPRKYLIDIDGFIVYDHIGEGGYDETESVIVTALTERAEVLGLHTSIERDTVTLSEKKPVEGARTPEIYFGSDRLQYLSNLPRKECLNTVCDYTIQKDVLPLHSFALGGSWQIEKENALSKTTDNALTLHFIGSQVNIVAGTEGNRIVKARIYLDGELLSGSFAGSAVDATGTVSFNEPTLYELVNLGVTSEHELKIEFIMPDVEVYTFTFG
jgi:thiol-disulfide isomerase/thioredoxin